MSTQMKSPSFIFVATLLVVVPTFAAADWILPKKGTVNVNGFMVVACAQTWYPEVCYNTLSPFASSTAKEPGRLALIALDETAKETKKFASRLTSLSGSVPGVSKVAIDGCLKTFEQNAATMTSSVEKLQKVVGSKSGQGFEDVMVNLETQVRAAATSVSTCADKLKTAGNSEVSQGIQTLKYGTTNAWNLVVFYFNDQTSPTFS